MANYNFYTNYTPMTSQSDGLSTALQLYSMINQKERQQRADIENWGKSQEDWALKRGELDRYAADSAFLKEALEAQDAEDLAIADYAYQKKLSPSDLQRMWNYRIKRTRDLANLSARAKQYEEDKSFRDKLMSNGQNEQIIWMKDDINADDYFRGSVQNSTTNLSGARLVAEAAKGVEAVVNKFAKDTQFTNGFAGGQLMKQLTKGDYSIAGALEAALKSDDPDRRQAGQTVLEAITNYMNVLRDSYNYNEYSERGKKAIDDAIWRGTWHGLDPVETKFIGDGAYISPLESRRESRLEAQGGNNSIGAAVREALGLDNPSPAGATPKAGDIVDMNTFTAEQLQKAGLKLTLVAGQPGKYKLVKAK